MQVAPYVGVLFALLRHPTAGILHRELDVSWVNRQILPALPLFDAPSIPPSAHLRLHQVFLDGRRREHVGLLLQIEVLHDEQPVFGVCLNLMKLDFHLTNLSLFAPLPILDQRLLLQNAKSSPPW